MTKLLNRKNANPKTVPRPRESQRKKALIFNYNRSGPPLTRTRARASRLVQEQQQPCFQSSRAEGYRPLPPSKKEEEDVTPELLADDSSLRLGSSASFFQGNDNAFENPPRPGHQQAGDGGGCTDTVNEPIIAEPLETGDSTASMEVFCENCGSLVKVPETSASCFGSTASITVEKCDVGINVNIMEVAADLAKAIDLSMECETQCKRLMESDQEQFSQAIKNDNPLPVRRVSSASRTESNPTLPEVMDSQYENPAAGDQKAVMEAIKEDVSGYFLTEEAIEKAEKDEHMTREVREAKKRVVEAAEILQKRLVVRQPEPQQQERLWNYFFRPFDPRFWV